MTKIQFDEYTKSYVNDLRKLYLLGAEASRNDAENVYSMEAHFLADTEEFEEALNAIEENIVETLEDEFNEKLERMKNRIANLEQKLASSEEIRSRIEELLAGE